jgi:hypothetical protein
MLMDILFVFRLQFDLFMEVRDVVIFHRISFFNGMLLIHFNPIQKLYVVMVFYLILSRQHCFLN